MRGSLLRNVYGKKLCVKEKICLTRQTIGYVFKDGQVNEKSSLFSVKLN